MTAHLARFHQALAEREMLNGGSRQSTTTPAVSACHAPSYLGAIPADVAQLEERDLAMVEAAGSSPAVRFHTGGHAVRPQLPAECWRTRCHEPATPHGRGLCEAHLEQARDQWDDDVELEASA